MKLILSPELAKILKNRIYIVSEIKIFKLGELSKEWGMSYATQVRYNSDKYRESSREVARNYRKKEQDEFLPQVLELKSQGLNSFQVSEALHLPLARINKMYSSH